MPFASYYLPAGKKNLKTDPLETTYVASTHPERTAALVKEWNAWAADKKALAPIGARTGRKKNKK